jgi:OFA family oxalate/formate antiporter-like MFS transporter
MRYLILVASIMVQICLGGLYAWSTFVPDLKTSYGLSTAQTQLIFGILIAVFTIAMVFSGRLLESKGPRVLLILCGLLFAAGYITASFSGGSFWMLLLGIGIISGVATGFGYVCPLSVCMRWFPEHKGLVTGIAVAGFGGGAVVLANLAEALLEHGLHSLLIFRWVGVIYGVAIILSGSVISFPSHKGAKAAGEITLNQNLVHDPYFWALVLAMFCGTFAGLLVIGNLMPMALAKGITGNMAAIGISAFAVGNAAGRISWGRLVDKMETHSVQASLILLALALVGLLAIGIGAILFIVIAFLTGFGFGACFVIHAALVASRYGINRVGNIYPLIFLAYGVAGITGPALGGWLYDFTASYSLAIWVSTVIVVLGVIGSTALVRRAGVKSA